MKTFSTSWVRVVAVASTVSFLFTAALVNADDYVPSDEEQNFSLQYILDANDQAGAGDTVELQFGTSLNEYLQWNIDLALFQLSDDLRIDGDFSMSGTTFTMDFGSSLDNTLRIIANQGIDDNGEIRYNPSTDRWEISNDGAAFSEIGGGGTLDDAYDEGGAGAGRAIAVTDGAIDLNGTGELLEFGDGLAADSFITFDDGTDRQLGWDDSDGALSTFDQQLRFRTIQSSTPPVACSATVAGMQWVDTDTGLLYVCDTSNSRNKWLSPHDVSLFGDESGSCAAGANPDSNSNCNVDWGNGLGPDGSSQLGLYIPYPITFTGVGFSADNDGCTSGTFDLEVRGTGSNSDDNTYSGGSSVTVDLLTGLNDEAHNSNSLNVDLDGDQYILWGIDNNCGQAIDDWNMIIYYRWRHN